jgi:hypothetical protein
MLVDKITGTGISIPSFVILINGQRCLLGNVAGKFWVLLWQRTHIPVSSSLFLLLFHLLIEPLHFYSRFSKVHRAAVELLRPLI